MSKKNSPAAKALRRQARNASRAGRTPDGDACIRCRAWFSAADPVWKYGAILPDGYLCAGCNTGTCLNCGDRQDCAECRAGREIRQRAEGKHPAERTTA